MRSKDSATPPTSGTLPPAVPVPRPRGTMGTFSVLHSLMTACTSSALIGKATANGEWKMRELS